MSGAAAPGRSSVLVTGASGWVGSALCKELDRRGFSVTALTRVSSEPQRGIISWTHPVADFEGIAECWPAQSRFDVCIHLAGVAHHRPDLPSDAFYQTNVLGTQRLLRACAQHGVPRFIYASSVKALGDEELLGRPWEEQDEGRPQDDYGRSTRDAEQLVLARPGIAETLVLRFPLVYGPKPKGNFASMLKWVRRGVPLPLGLASSPRSLIFRDNLIDAFATLAGHVGTLNGPFHATDDETLSVAQLLDRLALACQRRSRLIDVPPTLLRHAAALTGQQRIAQRLLSPLRLSTERLQREVGWSAPVGVEAALRQTVAETP